MGAIVNAISVVIFGLIGIFIKGGISERLKEHVLHAIGLCVVVFGASGALKSTKTLVLVLSLVIGAIIGEVLDLDQKVNHFVRKMTKKYGQTGSKNIAEGFIVASNFMCIGSMVIVGSLESGLTGDDTTLYAKSILDAITALLLSSTLGVGVVFASIPVLIIEGALIILASLLAPILVPEMIVEIVAVGSILLIGLGLNVLGVTKLKILNYVPAVILPGILMLFL